MNAAGAPAAPRGEDSINGINLPVAQLTPSAAEVKIHTVADALTTVAKHSGRPT